MIESYQKTGQYKTIAGIFFILLLLLLTSFTGSSPVLNLFGLSKINGTIFFVSRMLYWILLLLLFLYSTKIEKQKLLLWKEKKYSFLVYLVSVVVIFVALFAGLFIIQTLLSLSDLNKKSSKLSEIVEIFRDNMPLLVFTSLTAAVVEELIFRGYIQSRLELLFKKPSVAILLSSLLFGLLHYRYGTLVNVIGPVFIGFIFACYYQKYRNIKILIICHFLWDFCSLMIQVKQH